MSAADEEEDVYTNGYFLKTVPVDIEKLISLGIISL
jgi:hypothetical protein